MDMKVVQEIREQYSKFIESVDSDNGKDALNDLPKMILTAILG